MRQAVYISGAENKTAAKLQGIFSQFVLTMSPGLGAFTCERIVLAKKVQERSFFEPESAIGFALLVNQERKGDPRFFAKGPSIARVTEADRGESGAFGFDFRFVLAQLRDVLAAEYSTIVAKKHNYGRTIGP